MFNVNKHLISYFGFGLHVILTDALGSFGPSIHICGTLMFMRGVFFELEPRARRFNANKDKYDKMLVKCDRETVTFKPSSM